ncbi:paraquat-inducible protein A [Halopseudomonas maritima]|uniref:paraquat-inducible protein A n=1 Tax=Halopseudomonas maritima TaxID=2918528 RepID=UPI001EEB7A9E|nr:paraquat-inducible protein A [Halopseudomonas maritima]UJJ32520.1 paraquat-inducible protein A [Halopseudomonas maritima]
MNTTASATPPPAPGESASPSAAQPSGNLLACHECDLLLRFPPLEQHSRLTCPRCGHSLGGGGDQRLKRALPLAISAALLLGLSLMFPFMSFERAGVANQMTLLQAAIALFQDGSVILSVLVLVFIVLAPCALVACILLISCSLASQRLLPGTLAASRLMFALTSWNMVEVFIIGVFVSLVKIAGMAHVELGISLWTYLALAVALAGAIGALDRLSLWQRLDSLGAGR